MKTISKIAVAIIVSVLIGGVALACNEEIANVETMALNKTQVNLGIGSDEKLIATVNPIEAKDKSLQWTSSDTSIADVTDDGTVTAKSLGEALITVTTTDGSKTATATINVYSKVTNIANLGQLESALTNVDDNELWNITANINDINFTIKIKEKQNITILGNGHTLKFDGGQKDGLDFERTSGTIGNITVDMNRENPETWRSGGGSYALHIFGTKNVVLFDIKVTGANAGMYINASQVTLKGIIDVSGNGFGGMEVSRGSNKPGDGYEPLTNAILTIDNGATLINNTEASRVPTAWIIKDQGTISGGALIEKEHPDSETNANKKNQLVYYISEDSAEKN